MKKEKGEREWASECGGGFSRSPGQGQGRPVKVTWAVTGQEASREERRLPGKVQGAPLPPPAALPSQPVTVLHISGLSPLSSPRATVLSPGHTLLPLGERSNANWPTYFRLVPATNLSPLQPKRGFFQHQSFH